MNIINFSNTDIIVKYILSVRKIPQPNGRVYISMDTPGLSYSQEFENEALAETVHRDIIDAIKRCKD
jgi:hypothetical protein